MQEKEKKSVESRVADAMLERPITVEAGSLRLEVAPPSMATLVLVSEQAALLPVPDKDKGVTPEALRIAKECRPIGRMAAILAVGALALRKENRWWRRWLPSKAKKIERMVMEKLTPKQAASLVAQMLATMELGDFFALTAFLGGISKTKPTKAA